MISYTAIYSIIAYRLKEFFLEYQYSLLAPITTNLLFVLVFLTIESYYSLSIESSSFVQFIAPGLIIMIVAQESYNNPSVTLVNMKQIQGPTLQSRHWSESRRFPNKTFIPQVIRREEVCENCP